MESSATAPKWVKKIRELIKSIVTKNKGTLPFLRSQDCKETK